MSVKLFLVSGWRQKQAQLASGSTGCLKKPYTTFGSHTQHLVIWVETDLDHVVDRALSPLVVPPRLVEHLQGAVRVPGVPLKQSLDIKVKQLQIGVSKRPFSMKVSHLKGNGRK
jgi:hypothetical protein